MTVAILDQNGFNLADPKLDIARGAYRYATSVNQYGRNPSCAAGADEEIWNGSVAYSYPTSALMTKVSQTADQAAMRGQTVRIHGLDANWDYVEQDVILDAANTTTHVVLATLGTPLMRVFYAEINGSVVTTSSVRLHNDAETVDYFVMPTGNNTTALGWYTVPAGHTAYLTNWWANHNPTQGQTFTSNLIRLWATDNVNGYARKTRGQKGIAPDGGFVHHYNPYMVFTEKTDIVLTASPVGAAADVSAGFDLIQVKNSRV